MGFTKVEKREGQELTEPPVLLFKVEEEEEKITSSRASKLLRSLRTLHLSGGRYNDTRKKNVLCSW